MIVVSGEALMDVYPGSESAAGMSLDARMGGSPYNVAVGLARMGQAVSFFGGVSSGAMGERLMRGLQNEGVNTDAVVRPHAPTTMSMVELDAEGVPTYAFHGRHGADRQVTVDALAKVPAAQAYQFGSYAMVVEPIASTLRMLADREHQRSLVAYDPNVRLNVEPDLERWRQALIGMLPFTHVLKISAEDLDLMAPGLDPYKAAREWLDDGVSLVVVTRGRDGALAWTPSHHVVSHARQANVIDTVGAGDSFQAALLTALAERGALDPSSARKLTATSLSEIMSFASSAAAMTCSRRGADLPKRDEIVPMGPRGLAAA